MTKNCDFCNRATNELYEFGEARICFLCKLNQKSKPRGKEIKGDNTRGSKLNA